MSARDVERGSRRSGVVRRTEPGVLAAIAVGGALGAPARYGISQLVFITPGTFPWGTFWTNISGSFALGFFVGFLLRRFPRSRLVRPLVATGFLGAYTTYSTFAVEMDLLVRDDHVAIGLTYAVAGVVAGIVFVWAGLVVGRVIPINHGSRHGTPRPSDALAMTAARSSG
jgi:CrcB protein